jgi:hypothetical protein
VVTHEDYLQYVWFAGSHGPRGWPQLGPLLQEALHHLDVSASDGSVQRSHSVDVDVFDERAAVQEQLDHSGVSLEGGEVQRGAPRLVGVVDVGASLDQTLNCFEFPSEARPTQGGQPFAVLFVNLGPCNTRSISFHNNNWTHLC